MTHHVKTKTEFFQAGLDGRKPFEVRRNDRGYQCGDYIVEEELESSNEKTLSGRTHKRLITYVLADWGISSGFVVLGLKELNDETRNK